MARSIGVGFRRCLEAVRELHRLGIQITSESLAEEAEIEATERSPALSIAAGWISTLRRYGMLKPSAGERLPGRGRPKKVYEITSWGVRFKEKATSSPSLRKIAANPKKGR